MSTSNNLPEVIGLGGTFASGKDTLAEYLAQNFDFQHVSTGDIVRAVAQERYGNIERPTLQKTAIELRTENGSGVLVERALATGTRPIVLSGIRTAGEVAAIKAAGGVMMFVDADSEKRYERMRGRLRDGETELTLEEFLANEAKEVEVTASDADQNIGVVRSMSDIMLDNNGSKEEFFSSAIEKLQQHQTSPTASE